MQSGNQFSLKYFSSSRLKLENKSNKSSTDSSALKNFKCPIDFNKNVTLYSDNAFINQKSPRKTMPPPKGPIRPSDLLIKEIEKAVLDKSILFQSFHTIDSNESMILKSLKDL